MGFKRRPLREKEKELFEKINEGDIDAVKLLLRDREVSIDCLDETGMTPLQQAAFKGRREMCEMLIGQGANVNTTEHEHRYSTLSFAALGGHLDTVKYILAAGADVDSTNTLNRTASQMAAFVGFHEIVNTINSYFSKAELEYFTEPHGLEKKARLARHLVIPLYGLISETNVHPVKHLLYIKDHKELLAGDQSCILILEELCVRQVKQKETNEIMSLKMHYLGHLLRMAHKSVYGTHSKVENVEIKEEQMNEKLDGLMKTFLKGSSALDGFQLFMEKYLRQMIKEYPFHQSALLQQLIYSLSRTEIGGSPTAFNNLMQCLFGQHAMQSDDTKCYTCGTLNAKKRCTACKFATYCNAECQKMHWFTHKGVCKQLLQKGIEMRISKEKQTEEDRRMEMENIPPECMAAMDMAHMNSIKCPMNPPDGDGEESGVKECPYTGQQISSADVEETDGVEHESREMEGGDLESKENEGGDVKHLDSGVNEGGDIKSQDKSAQNSEVKIKQQGPSDKSSKVKVKRQGTSGQDKKCPVSGTRSRDVNKKTEIPAACPFSGKGVDGKKLNELLDAKMAEKMKQNKDKSPGYNKDKGCQDKPQIKENEKKVTEAAKATGNDSVEITSQLEASNDVKQAQEPEDRKQEIDEKENVCDSSDIHVEITSH